MGYNDCISCGAPFRCSIDRIDLGSGDERYASLIVFGPKIEGFVKCSCKRNTYWKCPKCIQLHNDPFIADCCPIVTKSADKINASL